jgi:hypothetical protein
MTPNGDVAEAEKIARICWEMNRGLQARDGEELPDPPWDAAPWYRKKALIYLVIKIQEGEITDPGDAHAFWCSYMTDKGWSFGERKDYELQTHPSLRLWEELTPRQQLAQRLSIQIVQLIAASEETATLQG